MFDDWWWFFPRGLCKFFLPVGNIGNSGGRLGWGICAWNDRKQRAPPPPEMMSVDKDTLKGKLMQTCKVNLNDTAKICWQKYFFHKVGEPIFAVFHLAVTPLLLQVLVFPFGQHIILFFWLSPLCWDLVCTILQKTLTALPSPGWFCISCTTPVYFDMKGSISSLSNKHADL